MLQQSQMYNKTNMPFCSSCPAFIQKKYLLNAWFAPAIVFGTSDLQMNYMSGEQVCMERPFYWGRQIVHK